jgi:hypothetical protein
MSQYIVDVIVPTYSNPEYLIPMVNSMARIGFFAKGDMRLIIVNNGKQRIREELKDSFFMKHTVIVDCEENRGWEGGLVEGLKVSDAPFVVFQNDDVFLPQASHGFYLTMLTRFNDDSVGMVGPVTTTAAGIQSIYRPNSPLVDTPVCWMIFFCVMIRRKFLDEIGGVDETLPGGDDFDLTMRMSNSGKKMIVTPYAFIVHHAFKTGNRVKGGPDEDGGWNSQIMVDRTNRALIQKHGFRNYFWQRNHQILPHAHENTEDKEGNLIRTLISKDESVLELGCGTLRTVPQSFTVDIIERDNVNLVGDVSKPLELLNKYDVIIARHIIEHVLDTNSLIKLWSSYLNKQGRIIIAVPNQHLTNSIPLDPQHCHAFTPDSLKAIMEFNGFKQENTYDPNNQISFVSEFRLCE